jgi:hypothetical protein
MTIDDKIPITADEHIREEIDLRRGQYVNNVFMELFGYELKCTMHRGYELWLGKTKSVILEPISENHFMVYKVFQTNPP